MYLTVRAENPSHPEDERNRDGLLGVHSAAGTTPPSHIGGSFVDLSFMACMLSASVVVAVSKLPPANASEMILIIDSRWKKCAWLPTS